MRVPVMISELSSRPNRPPDDLELVAARRNLRFLRLEKHVHRFPAAGRRCSLMAEKTDPATQAVIRRRAKEFVDAAPVEPRTDNAGGQRLGSLSGVV
jgi:hypothetical protein